MKIKRYSEVNLKKACAMRIFILFYNSWEASDRFEDNSIDFIFIDVDHSFESVTKDLKAWYCNVKKGGIMSGHDFFKYEVVELSVLTNLLFHKIEFIDNIWWIKR